jgi:hypothetical protein
MFVLDANTVIHVIPKIEQLEKVKKHAQLGYQDPDCTKYTSK